jgi:AcrR family transcriptional regulator
MNVPDSQSVHSGGQETRSRILAVSRDLFSQLGFDGTSIRAIASSAGTNIASINYHFKTKENLFWQVLAASFLEGESACRELSQASVSLEEFALKVYDHFCLENTVIRNTMKLIMSERLALPEDSEFAQLLAMNSFGPPGGKYFAAFITVEVGPNVPQEKIIWGVKTIFGTIVHWATVCRSTHIQVISQTRPYLTPEQFREDVRHVVRSTIQYISRT